MCKLFRTLVLSAICWMALSHPLSASGADLPAPVLCPNEAATVKVGVDFVMVRPPLADLEARVARLLSQCQGDWGVYVKDLSTGQSFAINDHAMMSASLIKLFIAGAIYEQIDLGNLSESSSILSPLDAMITYSDNESSNVLVRALCKSGESFADGLDRVNDFIARHGFSNTRQVNGIADPSLWVNNGYNQTSPKDCGMLLEMVYNRTLVSHYNCLRFESLLNRQQVNYKIPEGLPNGTHISHKTGEISDTENDAAIVYTPYGDYVLCILSTELTDTGSAVGSIRKIAGMVHDDFTSSVIQTGTGQPFAKPIKEHVADLVSGKPYLAYRISEDAPTPPALPALPTWPWFSGRVTLKP